MSRQTQVSSPGWTHWRGIIVLAAVVLASTRVAKAQATWTTVGSNTYCITCNVGIATSSPTQRLQLSTGNVLLATGDASTAGNLYFGGTTDTGQVGMRMFGGSNATYGFAGGFIDVKTTDVNDGLRIRVDTNFGGFERMRIAANGIVTIIGDLSVTGNIAAKYQDLAEWVPAREGMAPGTVVVLDDSTPNSVKASERPYDTKVAGVVSQRPGLVLGEAGPEKALVATTGRVKVRATARQGGIRIGDLLVTSEREGVAMRSEPVNVAGVKMHRPGTVVGKALENLAEGEGEILVLLSLQ